MMTYNSKNNPARKHKIVLAVTVILAVALLALGYYFLHLRSSESTNNTPKPDSTEAINLDPPTKAELDETEQFKQSLTNSPVNSPTTGQSTQGQNVTPIIGYLQQSGDGSIESNGYIPGAAETNSTCTLVLEKDGVKVTESRQTMMDAQGIICGRLVISRSKLTEGSWKARISYESSTQKGLSEERKIEVK